METIKQDYSLSEKISIGDKKYINTSGGKKFEELLKEKGSFVNILANSLLTGKPLQQTTSAWR